MSTIYTQYFEFEAEIETENDFIYPDFKATVKFLAYPSIPGDSINPPENAFVEFLDIKVFDKDENPIDYKVPQDFLSLWEAEILDTYQL